MSSRAEAVVVELPPIADSVLRQHAERVQLPPAVLLQEALRCAPWYRDAVERLIPREVLLLQGSENNV